MLFENMMEDFTIMNKVRSSDGEGGIVTRYEPGAVIKVACVNDTSLSAKVAEADGVTSTWTLTTTRENALEYHDIIRRNRDNKVLRVTSDPDTISPAVSSLNMAQVSAEKWVLTND